MLGRGVGLCLGGWGERFLNMLVAELLGVRPGAPCEVPRNGYT